MAVTLVLLLVLAGLTWPPTRTLVTQPPPTGQRGLWRTLTTRLGPGLRRPPGLARASPTSGDGIADFTELLALCLSAGLPAAQALQLAEGSPSGGSTVHAQVHELAAALRSDEIAAPPQEPGSLLVAAWGLSRDRGAALTEVARTCAVVLREAEAGRRREHAAAAGPTASMWLLTLLPLVGPAAGLLVGVDLRQTYANPAAAGSVTVGLLLTGTGWIWSRSLLRRARRPVIEG